MNREIFKVTLNSSVVSIHKEIQHFTGIYNIINKNAEKGGPNIEPCGIHVLIFMIQDS